MWASGVATGRYGGKMPSHFAKVVLEISLKSIGKIIEGGGVAANLQRSRGRGISS